MAAFRRLFYAIFYKRAAEKRMFFGNAVFCAEYYRVRYF